MYILVMLSSIYIKYTLMRASVVAQRLKHLPAMQETWVRSLGWEDPLEKEMVTHSSILAWRIPWSLVGYSPRGHKEQTSLSLSNLNETNFKNCVWNYKICSPMVSLGFPGGSVVKNPPANAGIMCLIPVMGGSPGEGNDNSLQYSCLGILGGHSPCGCKADGND